MLDLLQQPLAQILERANVPVLVALLGHGNEPVIAFRCPVLGLLSLQDAEEASRDLAARGDGLVQQEEDVKRVAVEIALTEPGETLRRRLGRHARAASK